MRCSRSLALLLIGAAGLMAVAGLMVMADALGRPQPGHMPLHIGCRHHNHGAKWHADHGRILGSPRRAVARTSASSADDLGSRSLVAGRSRSE